LYFEGREFIWPEPPPFDEAAAAGGEGEGGAEGSVVATFTGAEGAANDTVAKEATEAPRPQYFMPNVDKPKKLGKDRRLQPGWDKGEPVLWRMKWDDAIEPHGGWTYVQPGTGGHNRFGDFCPEFSQREDPLTMTTKHDDIMLCFERYDVDDSGEIDEDELRQLLVKELAIPVTDESVAQAMSEMDVDGDGAVVPEELLKWFARQSHMDHSHSVRAKELELKARRAVRNVGRTILAKIIPSEQQRLENKRKKEEASEARRMKLLRLGASGPLLALINAGYVAEVLRPARRACTTFSRCAPRCALILSSVCRFLTHVPYACSLAPLLPSSTRTLCTYTGTTRPSRPNRLYSTLRTKPHSVHGKRSRRRARRPA